MRARHGIDRGGLLAAAVYVLCATYLHVMGSLLGWGTVPVVTGLTPTLIVSDSMSPRINAGDLVLTRSSAGKNLKQGQVITFDDAARPGRLLTHRIAAVNVDGTYRTRGDANSGSDSSAVSPEAVRGVGTIVVPAVGIPAIWIRDGSWLPVLLWLAGSALAILYLVAHGRVRTGLAGMWGWTSALSDVAPPPRPAARPAAPAGWEPPLPSPLPRRVATAGLVVAMVIAGLVVPRVSSSEAAFMGKTRNSNNQLAAATSFCTLTGTQTLTPVADTEIREDGTVSTGMNAALNVRSKNKNTNIRALLRFDLPPSIGCSVTAKLRVNLSVANTSRVLQVFNAPVSWNESDATWAGMPLPAVTPVANATPALGWIEMPVTEHVLAMYSGSNHGFLLMDQTEGSGGSTGNTQTFASRNATDATLWPQLVLTFGATAAKPPAPTGLTATATSASRIALSWTDTATDETSYTVQRSAGGAGTWTTIATLAADSASHTDTGLASETTYDYRVRSTNTQGDSAWSNIASATTEAAPAAAPAAPTELTSTASSVNAVDLSWTDNATDEDAFTIEASPAGAGTWTQVGTVGPDVTTFSATELTANTAYDFRVRATNNTGASDWSNTVTASTATCASLAAQTLTPTHDAIVAQAAPGAALGLPPYDTTFLSRSEQSANIRGVVKFDSPTVPLGCSVASATLRLNVASYTSVRTLHVWRASGAWDESTVTWNLKPTRAGTPTAATTVLGWVPFDVSEQVSTMLSGTNDGFVVGDSVEDAGTRIDVNMSPKEGANPPQLVVTLQ